jgi:hypothetical protein
MRKPSEQELEEFIDDCISSGKCMLPTDGIIDLSDEVILYVDDVIYLHDEETARAKIRKILKQSELCQ